jgi:uncharacterized membrane protein (UPF0127 family)
MKSRLRSAAAALVLALSLAIAHAPARHAAAQSPVRFERGTLHILQDDRRIILNVEIARTMQARSQGLMNRTSLAQNAGMLFVFEESGKWGFWMKNTLIPLSIGFIDHNWRLLEVFDMKVADDPVNGPFPIYEPKQEYRYALEVNKGYFERHSIMPGARLSLVVAR